MDSDYLHILIPLILCLVPIEFMLLAVAGKIAASSPQVQFQFCDTLVCLQLGFVQLGRIAFGLNLCGKRRCRNFCDLFFHRGLLIDDGGRQSAQNR